DRGRAGARGRRAGGGGRPRERHDAGAVRAHPPREGAARALPPARRCLRSLLHRGPDAAPRADPARCVDRGLRGLRRAALRQGMIPARWAVAAPPDPGLTTALADQLHIPEPLAAILVQRGLTAPERAKAFLRPGLERLSDPLAWLDMQRAVELVARAVRAAVPILVHGDYDVDGQCAAALLTRVLRSVGAQVQAFVPHRLRDGYDFGEAGLREARRVRDGLKMLADSRWTGLRALVDAAGLAGRPIKAGHVGFILAPRLNAAGRIGEPAEGLRLLLADDSTEAAAIARELETLNARRQE